MKKNVPVFFTWHFARILTMVSILIVASTSFSFAQMTYGSFVIGGRLGDNGTCIIQTKDSGYAFTGRTYSFGNDTTLGSVYVVKSDVDGQIKWTKTIGGKYQEMGTSIIQTKDGGYALTGQTFSFADTLNGDVYPNFRKNAFNS